MASWDLSEVYSKSFAVVKKNKVLWVFGAFLTGSATFGLENSFNQDASYFDGLFSEQPTTNPLAEVITQTFSGVPPSIYLLFGIEILALIAFAITLTLITRAWGAASLIQGIQLALKGKQVSIAESSKLGFCNLKQLIIFQILTSLIGLGLVLAAILVGVVLGVGIFLGGLLLKIIFGLLLILLIFAFLGVILFFTITIAFGERQVVLLGSAAKDAIYQGFKIARQKFWASLLLGFVNNLLAGAINLVITMIILAGFVGPIIGGLFSFQDNPSLATVLFTLAGVVLTCFIIISTLAYGIIAAFKASTWTIAFNSLIGKKDAK